MSRRGIALAAAVVVVLAVVVTLLVSGGARSPSAFDDPRDDVALGDGPNAPDDTALADVVEANVTRDGNSLVFEARMAKDVPKHVPGGSLTWRWDLYVHGVSQWIVSADLDVGPNASLTSTQTNYGSSTFDDTLPGDLSIDGRTLTITLHPDDVKGFPETFDWTLGTTLDGDHGDPGSALATDLTPDQGRGKLE